MTMFLDCRYQDVGGGLGASMSLFAGTTLANYASISTQQLQDGIRGRNVLVGTHGFNVNRGDGIDCLDKWGSLLQLTSQDVFVGLLWPGDSAWAHGLDYFAEPRIADETGHLLAPFLDSLFAQAASVSFASHSLGARVVLSTVQAMKASTRRVLLMAGAVDDDCLVREFKSAAGKVGEISVLASQKDTVLGLLYPLGDPLSGILDVGHPWFHGALGRGGPADPRPSNLRAPFEIPDGWEFDHGDYLRVAPPSPGPIALPVDVPPQGASYPLAGAGGWQESWSSAFASTRFKA